MYTSDAAPILDKRDQVLNMPCCVCCPCYAGGTKPGGGKPSGPGKVNRKGSGERKRRLGRKVIRRRAPTRQAVEPAKVIAVIVGDNNNIRIGGSAELPILANKTNRVGENEELPILVEQH